MCLEALAIRERVLGSEHPSLGLNLLNLARVYRMLGRNAEAEEMFRRSLAVYRAAYDPGHPQRVELTEVFAEFLREFGRDDEAKTLESQEAPPADLRN